MHTTIKNNTVFLHNSDLSGSVIIRTRNTSDEVRIPISDLKAFLNENEESDAVQLASVDNFTVAEIEDYDKRQEAAMKILNTPERHLEFNAAVEKVKSKIDFSKHGSVTESLMQFAEEMNGVTYTELNMFYLNKNHETYDSYRDRGGSLTKHMASMRNSAKRVYSGKWKGMYKNNGLWNCQN